MLFGKRRPAMERIANQPVELEVGTGAKKLTLTLREPTMFELVGFLEKSVADLVPVYSEKMTQIERIAKTGDVATIDFGLFAPAFEPVCDFVAMIADRPELKGELHKMVTPAQFMEALDKTFYLMDLERLWSNFSDVLARVQKAKAKVKNRNGRSSAR